MFVCTYVLTYDIAGARQGCPSGIYVCVDVTLSYIHMIYTSIYIVCIVSIYVSTVSVY